MTADRIPRRHFVHAAPAGGAPSYEERKTRKQVAPGRRAARGGPIWCCSGECTSPIGVAEPSSHQTDPLAKLNMRWDLPALVPSTLVFPAYLLIGKQSYR